LNTLYETVEMLFDENINKNPMYAAVDEAKDSLSSNHFDDKGKDKKYIQCSIEKSILNPEEFLKLH